MKFSTASNYAFKHIPLPLTNDHQTTCHTQIRAKHKKTWCIILETTEIKRFIFCKKCGIFVNNADTRLGGDYGGDFPLENFEIITCFLPFAMQYKHYSLSKATNHDITNCRTVGTNPVPLYHDPKLPLFIIDKTFM